MTELIPTVNPREACTLEAAQFISAERITIRAQDLVCGSGEMNWLCKRIKVAGGIHSFLGNYDGQVILSLVMPDELLLMMDPERYERVILAVKPDKFTTVDGETYEREHSLSKKELRRCIFETRALLQRFPSERCIGLVKGCTREQIVSHARLLRSLGITEMMLHAGDFMRRGRRAISTLKGYAAAVRPHAQKLYLHGMSSPKRFLEFSFCDAFITYGHFAAATSGVRLIGHKRIPRKGEHYTLTVKKNLLTLKQCMTGLEQQTKLDGGATWVVHHVAEDPITLMRDTPVAWAD